MKDFDGLKMSDEFYKYAIYKKELGEILKVDAILTEDGELVAKEYEISETEEINMQIYYLDKKLKSYDYIGTKIATGRATREEYSERIAQMDVWAEEINTLRERLKLIKQQ